MTVPLPDKVPPPFGGPVPEAGPCIEGGIVACFGEHHYFSILRRFTPSFGKPGERSWWNRFDVTGSGPHLPFVCENIRGRVKSSEPVHLAVSRERTTFTASISHDGKKWDVLKTVDWEVPETVPFRLMLLAWQETLEPCEVVFENLTIGSPGGIGGNR
jgi:hypothetical protein